MNYIRFGLAVGCVALAWKMIDSLPDAQNKLEESVTHAATNAIPRLQPVQKVMGEAAVAVRTLIGQRTKDLAALDKVIKAFEAQVKVVGSREVSESIDVEIVNYQIDAAQSGISDAVDAALGPAEASPAEVRRRRDIALEALQNTLRDARADRARALEDLELFRSLI